MVLGRASVERGCGARMAVRAVAGAGAKTGPEGSTMMDSCGTHRHCA
jgi:hypothetical protein